MDTYIEDKTGRSINEIFETEGETAFREAERAALKEIIANRQETVVASGGGTPCFQDNMQLMKAAGTVVYLQAQPQTLVARLEKSYNKRPMFADVDAAVKVAQLLTAREAIYLKADYTIKAETATVQDFENIVELCINRH